MLLESTTSPNAILHLPLRDESSANHKDSQTPPLIFLITGNPGLVSYYEEFLSHLAEPSASRSHGSNPEERLDDFASKSVIAGFSLGGFAFSPSAHPALPSTQDDLINDLLYPPSFPKQDIYSLPDQINLCYSRLEHLCMKLQQHYSDLQDGLPDDNNDDPTTARSKTSDPIKVILLGHSVGAYIALELIRLHHERIQLRPPHDSRKDSSTLSLPTPPHSFTILSSQNLTPTITHISQSSSGQIATPLLTNLTFLPSLLQYAASGLGYLPLSSLEWLVSRITGMKRDSVALRTTVAFLRGKDMVKQALRMARDEMVMMQGDSWGEEVWGRRSSSLLHLPLTSTGDAREEAEDSDGDVKQDPMVTNDDDVDDTWNAPKLYFLFAKVDHWVADRTRDEFLEGLETRYVGEAEDVARRKPTVVIDEDGELVHAWCLAQSEVVAWRVRGWIEEVLNAAV